MELFGFFQNGDLEHVNGSAVLYDKFEVLVDFVGVVVLSLFEFVHDGVEVHGVFDFIVVANDSVGIDRFFEDFRAFFISKSEDSL